MTQPFRIRILASGPHGCGKSRAIKILTEVIAQHPDFQWIDGRYYECAGGKFIDDKWEGDEEQVIELKLK